MTKYFFFIFTIIYYVTWYFSTPVCFITHPLMTSALTYIHSLHLIVSITYNQQCLSN